MNRDVTLTELFSQPEHFKGYPEGQKTVLLHRQGTDDLSHSNEQVYVRDVGG